MQQSIEAEFYRSAREVGKRFARRTGLSVPDAEDCEQIYVIKWLPGNSGANWRTLSKSEIEAIITASARNHALNFARGRRREAARAVLETRCALIAYMDADPGESLFRDLFWDKLADALRTLSPSDRAVIRMCDLGQVSINEAAAILESRPDSIKHQLARIHKRLKAVLVARGDTESELRSCLGSANRSSWIAPEGDGTDLP